MVFLYLVFSFFQPASKASAFHCGGGNQPERQIIRPNSCDDTAGFDLVPASTMKRPELAKTFKNVSKEQIEKSSNLKDLALEAKFRLTSNMNGAKFSFPSGVDRVVFRGSYLAPQFTKTSILQRKSSEKDRNQECMSTLVKKFDLAKIVNYDELDWPSAVRMTKEEKEALLGLRPSAKYWEFTKANGYTFQYKFAKGRGATEVEKKEDIMKSVASIIYEIEGSPAEPGAVYIHCYGGHHRTGAVYGVMQKCIGKMPVEAVIDEYKCHIGWKSEQSPGGYHVDNVQLIRDFPCERFFSKEIVGKR